jgi:hypothetical protein
MHTRYVPCSEICASLTTPTVSHPPQSERWSQTASRNPRRTCPCSLLCIRIFELSSQVGSANHTTPRHKSPQTFYAHTRVLARRSWHPDFNSHSENFYTRRISALPGNISLLYTSPVNNHLSHTNYRARLPSQNGTRCGHVQISSATWQHIQSRTSGQ